MKVAYILLAHKDPEQLVRLIDSLKGTGDFYIHIDKKSDIRPFQDCFKNNPSVHLLKKRINVTWAGWSMVKGYMLLLEAALKSDKNYSRFVMLTGQDYPLMKNSEITAQFVVQKDIEYIMAYNLTTSTVPTDKNKVLRRWYLDNPFRSHFYKGHIRVLCTIV